MNALTVDLHGYEARAFHPTLDPAGTAGRLRLAESGAQFESSKGNFNFPIEGLQVTTGGATETLIFFTHLAQPQAAIHTSDLSVLNDPVFANRPEFIPKISSGRNKHWVAATVILIFLGILIAGIIALVASKDRIVRTLAETIPIEWELKLGEQLFQQVAQSQTMINDPALTAQLGKITAPLVGGITNSRYPLKFHIVDDATLNAFALPGGHMIVHSGLLLAADAPEEVASVMAHEIAHVTERHGFRKMISSLGLYQILQAFVGDASSLLAVLANNTAFLAERRFSRDFEREADQVGWNYLVAANIAPDGMIRFFKKLQAEEQKQSPGEAAGTALAILNTHPATQERLDSLEARWKKLENRSGFHRFDLNYSAFKQELRGKVRTNTTVR
jgi:predicted Zn-dependent protease